MNHTIKGIIIVVAITSMLVVGANIVPIMQNASARSTNTNSNTNSADSSSSSNATASNTNNIDNTATASSNQNQNACAVAITCSQGSTTVTPPVPVDNCPAGTLYDVTTTIRETTVELCLPGNPGTPLGPQTATIAGTTTTIPVVISNPNTATCPPGSGIRADVTSGRENVPGFNTVCVNGNR